MAKDMTKGNISEELIKFSIPLILSGLLHQLYSWADAFIVGNVNGEKALAAIGATNYINSIFLFTILGFTMGLAILAGQQYGRGDRKALKKDIDTFSVFLGILSVISVILAMIFVTPLLRFLNTPAEIFEDANSYIKIVLAGIPFIVIYNVYSAVIRGMGDSKAPFYSVLISSVLNIILDIVFVFYFKLGVKGAAIATVISQALMALFIIYYLCRFYEGFRFSLNIKNIDINILKEGVKLGIPISIQSSLSSIGYLALQNFMNGFGVSTVAAITTSYKVDSILILPMLNLSSAISTFVAQNIGSDNLKRAKKGLKTGIIMMIIIGLFQTGFVLLFGKYAISVFNLSEKSLDIGGRFFISLSRFYTVLGIAMCFRAFLEGAGDVKFTSVGIIIVLICQVVFSYTLVGYYDNMVIAYAEGYAWIVELILFSSRFLFKRKIEKNA